MISVAIDGPAGAGKSSVSRAVAARLGYIYVDTGALYRTVALSLINAKIDVSDESAVQEHLSKISVDISYVGDEQRVFLNGNDVSELIRSPEVSMGASKASALPCVRQFLFDKQRDLAVKNNVVMDGRDIGTVVLPEAQVKIYLTATAEERARRRMKEMLEKGQEADFDSVLEDIKKRDRNDMNRPISPLKKADDAILVDTTDTGGYEKSVELLLDMIRQRLAEIKGE